MDRWRRILVGRKDERKDGPFAYLSFERDWFPRGRRRCLSQSLGACSSHPSLRGKGDVGRCEAAGSKEPEA
jgi:hypothetical protein